MSTQQDPGKICKVYVCMICVGMKMINIAEKIVQQESYLSYEQSPPEIG